MTTQEYLASGILELYVAGTLSEQENEDVYKAMQNDVAILNEVIKIEKSIVTLTSALSSKDFTILFDYIKNKLVSKSETKVIPISSSKESGFAKYSGWVAAVLVGGVLVWSLITSNDLKQQVANSTTEKENLEQQVEASESKLNATENELASSEKIINIIRDENVINVPLAGQKVAPSSYAKVYIDNKTNSYYVDVKGLPKPPEGKVYQVWSLTLKPLTPTSMGTLANFDIDKDKIFKFDAIKGTEGFGITLEPAGGSKTPTLEQLYTLGVIES